MSVDAAAGVRAWDQQARIVLRIGPLDLAYFERLLPDQPLLRELIALVRAYVGFEVGFAVNPVLAGDAVPALALAPPDKQGAGQARPSARMEHLVADIARHSPAGGRGRRLVRQRDR